MSGTGDETSRIAQWLFEVLSSDQDILDGTSGVYELPLRPDVELPAVGFSLLSTLDTTTADTKDRIFSRQVWTVRVIVQDWSFATAVPLADRIDALLQGSSGSAGGAVIYGARRESSLRMVEDSDGKPYRHLGGVYEVTAQITGD